MPPIAPSRHLTSSTHVRAGEFIRREEDPKSPVLALMSVIGDRFARYLPPNFCVQLETPVLHKELRLFLAPVMRNSLTMCHVFKMRLLFTSNNGTDSVADLSLLLSTMRNMLTYITQLELILGRKYNMMFAESEALHSALLASLPPSLESVALKSSSSLGAFPIQFNADDIQVLAAMPQLHELRLLDATKVSDDGVAELFREKKPSGCAFFPNLQRLEAAAIDQDYYQLLSIASKSIILPNLWEFGIEPHFASGDADVATLKGLLQSLAHVRVLGDSALANLNFAGPLDLSPLDGCARVGNYFLRDGDFSNNVVDVSVMANLEWLGSHFLFRAKNVKQLVLPPNLRHIGLRFCSNAAITALDFDPIADSLQSIDVTSMARESLLTTFDSTALTGKIVGEVGSFLYRCARLVEVDLTGFNGVVSVETGFLRDCAALVAVRGTAGMQSVETIGEGFMSGTASLAVCDFSKMVSLRSVGAFGALQGSALEESGKAILWNIMVANTNKNKQ